MDCEGMICGGAGTVPDSSEESISPISVEAAEGETDLVNAGGGESADVFDPEPTGGIPSVSSPAFVPSNVSDSDGGDRLITVGSLISDGSSITWPHVQGRGTSLLTPPKKSKQTPSAAAITR